MKIVNNIEKKVEFLTIPNGYVFEFDGEIYMAAGPFKAFDEPHYNAVRLADGWLCNFKRDAEVIPCLAQVEIIKKGSYV